MKKAIIILVLLIAMLAPIASATTSELVWKEHPWLYQLGIGDRLYKVTYDDGNTTYLYVRGTFLKPGYITYYLPKIVVPVGGDPSGQVTFDVVFEGASCKLLGGNRAYTDFISFQTADTRETIGALTEIIQCEQHYPKSISILNGGLGSRINTPGTYRINIIVTTDLITMQIVEYKYVDLEVGGTGGIYQRPEQTVQPTPTPTATLPPGQCRDSYGNIYTCTTPTPAVTATSTPPPLGSGQISVSSNIQGNVYIDGSYVGTTGSTFTVSGGGHSVKVTQTGYNDYITSVTVDSGRTSSVTATLNAASTGGGGGSGGGSTGGTAQGYIIVWSSPSEAKVYVNDVEKGTTGTDWLSIQMPVGTYTVKVIKGGYEAYNQSVTVVANDNVKVEARMTIISPPQSTATATSTGTPAATSGMAIETPAPKTTIGGYACPQGTVWNADRTGCIVQKKTIGEKIDQLPGFEALFAIAGLVAVSYLVLRQKEKKKKDDKEEEK